MELRVSNQVPLKKGIYPGLIKYAPKKCLGFSWQKKKNKDLKCEKDLIWGDSLLLVLTMEGTTWQWIRLAPRTWEQSPADSKIARTLVLQLQELNASYNQLSLKMDPELQVRWAVSPAETLMLHLWDLSRELSHAWTSDLQSCELKMGVVLSY